MRLWAGEQLVDIAGERSKDSLPILMPGYTHLQRVQPVRFSH